MLELNATVNQLLQSMGQRSKEEASARTEMAHQFKMVFADQQERHEQLISTLVNSLTPSIQSTMLVAQKTASGTQENPAVGGSDVTPAKPSSTG
jgi:hypothetical protein